MIEPYFSCDKPTYLKLAKIANAHNSGINQILNLLVKCLIEEYDRELKECYNSTLEEEEPDEE